MLIEDAKKYLEEGRKMRHDTFLEYEYIYKKEGVLFDEKNQELSERSFWYYRDNNKHFKFGWFFYKEPTL